MGNRQFGDQCKKVKAVTSPLLQLHGKVLSEVDREERFLKRSDRSLTQDTNKAINHLTCTTEDQVVGDIPQKQSAPMYSHQDFGRFWGARSYEFYAPDNSMLPRYRLGELLFVNSTQKAQIGDFVVVEFKQTNTTSLEIVLGILIRRNKNTIELKILNPPTIIEIDKNIIGFVHRILTTNDLFGI